MTMRSMRCVSFLLLSLLARRVKCQSAAPCPTDAGINGYTTLDAINTDMFGELAAITAGSTPAPPYVYTLCPNTMFDGNVTLTPVLSGAVFECGARRNSTDNCVIDGGTIQVSFEDSTVPGYTLEIVTFYGITFQNFTILSVGAFATESTMAVFEDVIWRDFNATSVVQQQITGAAAMSVAIDGAQVIAGEATNTLFVNDAAVLDFANVDFSSIFAGALIATGNGGVTFLSNANIVQSSILSVTFTTSGGTQMVDNVVVRGNTFLQELFFTQRAGTTTIVDGAIVEDNNIEPNGFVVMQVEESATASLTAARVQNNRGLESGVRAMGFATATVTNTDFIFNVNPFVNELTAGVIAFSDSVIDIDRCQFNDNRNYTANVLAIFRSNATIFNSCMVRGNPLIAVFIDEDSFYDVGGNFAQDLNVIACGPPEPWLFQERENSTCFQGPDCLGDCMNMTDPDLTMCAADDTMAPVSASPSESPSTMFPSVSPSRVPSTSPSMAPTGLATSATDAPTQQPSLAPSGTPSASFTPTSASGTPAPTAAGTPAMTAVLTPAPSGAPTITTTAATPMPSTPTATSSPTSIVSQEPSSSISPTAVNTLTLSPEAASPTVPTIPSTRPPSMPIRPVPRPPIPPFVKELSSSSSSDSRHGRSKGGKGGSKSSSSKSSKSGKGKGSSSSSSDSGGFPFEGGPHEGELPGGLEGFRGGGGMPGEMMESPESSQDPPEVLTNIGGVRVVESDESEDLGVPLFELQELEKEDSGDYNIEGLAKRYGVKDDASRRLEHSAERRHLKAPVRRGSSRRPRR